MQGNGSDDRGGNQIGEIYAALQHGATYICHGREQGGVPAMRASDCTAVVCVPGDSQKEASGSSEVDGAVPGAGGVTKAFSRTQALREAISCEQGLL